MTLSTPNDDSSMITLLVDHIRQLVTVAAGKRGLKTGPDMRDLGIIHDATVLIQDGRIRWVGPSREFRGSIPPDAHVLDASSFVGMPGFVDSHTHAVFAGSREEEFALRSQGATYQQIAEQGGGIFSTVRATRAASKKDLKKLAARRLDRMMKQGTTTVEIKTGYGLDEENEAKMLEVIRELRTEHLASVVGTFLGAHAIPPEHQSNPGAYLDLLCERMLPYAARRASAEFCDVFCEQGYFSVEQSRRILSTARSLGLKLKVHADELAPSGGSLLAAELGAISADHLEHISDEGIRALREAGVIATLLPGVSFFLHHAYAPARKLIDASVPVALASDFNPGSCMSFNRPMMMTIACTQMGMTPEEALAASTLNGAAALARSDRTGSIEVGKDGDLVLYDIPDYRYLPYHFGEQLVAHVIRKGVLLEIP
jgi:imidazolonepropionase